MWGISSPSPLSVGIEFGRVKEIIEIDSQTYSICEIRRERIKRRRGIFKVEEEVYHIHKLSDCSWNILILRFEGPKNRFIPCPNKMVSEESEGDGR